MPDDRRKFLRVPAEFRVEVQPKRGGAPFTATTVDISAGGAKLTAGEPVAAGSELHLEIRFTRPTSIVFVDATVVRTGEGGAFAVQFHDLDRYIEQRIVRWVFAEDRRAAERRAAVRVPIEVLAWCRAGAGGPRFRAATIDIAADGARIITPTACEIGDRIAIEFDVDEPAYRVDAVAEIMWKQRARDGRSIYGMRFETLDRATQRQIVEHALHAAGSRTPPSGGAPDTPN